MQTAEMKQPATVLDAPAPEGVVNDAPRLHATFDPPCVSYQGDLAIVALNALPATRQPRLNRQLADGQSQGSRHVLERGEVFDADKEEVRAIIRRSTISPRFPQGILVPTDLIGPVFVSPSDPTENDLTHPEHGNQGFPPGQMCAVVFQRSLDAEEREQRVLD